MIAKPSLGRILALACALVASPAAASAPVGTAVTQVFGDGQKLVAIAIDYGRPIRSARLSASTYRVDGRTILSAFAANAPNPDSRAAEGRYVIITLSPDDKDATLLERGSPPPGGGPPGGGGSGPPAHLPAPKFKPAVATVHQTAPILGSDGHTVPSFESVTTSRVRNLIVDDFRQLTFRDPRTGDTLKYNLFIPKEYRTGRSLPLVLFMHDLGSSSTDATTTLRQGLGAIAWASPRDQARHPSFVLAPEYPSMVVNDQSQTTSMFDTTVDLVNKLAADYHLDRSRLYTTGQSGGAMMSIAMNIRHPNLFAASYIVAGQWDPAKVGPLAKDKLWIMVSQGDLKAFPGENAITELLRRDGARVATAVWDGRWKQDQFARAFAQLDAEHAPINYVALRKGTVVPPEQPDDGGANHVNTWRIAYTIPEIRDWLFRQHQ